MALGDARSTTTNSKTVYEPTYYSRTRFKDKNENYLSFEYRSRMVHIIIQKYNQNSRAYENLGDIFVTPTKSSILLNQIAEFKKYIEEGNIDPNAGFGINAGMGEISSLLILHADKTGHKIITLAKIDSNGAFTSKADYEFNDIEGTIIPYGLKWTNINDNASTKKMYAMNEEFNEFENLIKQFYLSSNGANGYFTADIARYDRAVTNNKFNAIYDKLGIVPVSNNPNRRNFVSNNNYFEHNEMNRPAVSNHRNMDEIMDDLDSD